MTPEDWKNITAAVQSVATVLAMLIGGFWVYRTYIRQQLHRPNVEFGATLNIVGRQGSWWIVELIATVENKGKAQHRMKALEFDLNGLTEQDPANVDERWGGQVDFPRALAKGSFLPSGFSFFFVDPGVKAKYSYVTRVPLDMHMLNLHCWFKYQYWFKHLGHSAEVTLVIPPIGSSLTGAV